MNNNPSSPISITLPSLNNDTNRGNRYEDNQFDRNSMSTIPITNPTSNDMRKYEGNQLNSRELIAVKMIENAWCSYRDRQMFRLLKHAVCAAEHSLSHEILRKISPLEANLLRDPCINLKTKFRFGGTEFPPVILFKIYTQITDGNTTKYINGKNSIKPATKAAREACKQMGNRIFYEQLVFDTIQVHRGKIFDEEDVITLKDYMQYSSTLDELSARRGGRANTWRRLNLEDVPRHTIFYDIINYAATKKISNSLARELPALLEKPTSNTVQLQHIEILSKLTNPEPTVNTSAKFLSNSKNFEVHTTSRRSKNALNKVAKMKKAYTFARSETLNTDIEMMAASSNPIQSEKNDDMNLNDEFDDQVNDLYLWTQNLSIHDDFLKSPRLPNS